MVLYGVFIRSRRLALSIFGRSQFNVHWIVQAHSQESRFTNPHRPAHALDCDLSDSAGEFTVLDLAVVVVIARVNLGNVLGAQLGNDVLRYQWFEHVLILISCRNSNSVPTLTTWTAVCV